MVKPGFVSQPVNPETLEKLLRDDENQNSTEARPASQPISEAELIEGLAGAALQLVYRPKVSIDGARVHGVEALARWNHAERGILYPATFVPLAEATSRIDKLTDSVFLAAIAQAGRWRKAGLDLTVSVNFSVDNLNRLDLPEKIASCARAEGVAPSNIIIEVTESLLMKNLKSSVEILSRLRLRGFGLSIDDFGTGYASMEQLKRAPFTELKVDRSFVTGAANDMTARTILESSIRLGRALDMTVVAEGAETRQDWDVLASLGCDLVQGYFVAKPMPAEEVADWCRDWKLRSE